MKSIIILALALLFTDRLTDQAQGADFTYDTLIKKIAFGSIQNHRANDSHWKAVNTELPNIWVWLGGITQTTFAGPKQKKKAYDKVLDSLGYQELRARSQILGVWDEEDARPNSSKNRAPFLEFMGEAFNSPRFKRASLFVSYLIGPKGKRIKLILLDTYTQREKSSHHLLGSSQWHWLEKELSADTDQAQVILIGTPLSFLGNGPKNESWRDYKTEQQKLLTLIGKINTPTYIMSGHNGYGEFSSIELASGQRLIEVGSSGLNKTASKAASNEYRVGEPVLGRNFGILEFQWPASESADSVSVTYRIQNL